MVKNIKHTACLSLLFWVLLFMPGELWGQKTVISGSITRDIWGDDESLKVANDENAYSNNYLFRFSNQVDYEKGLEYLKSSESHYAEDLNVDGAEIIKVNQEDGKFETAVYKEDYLVFWTKDAGYTPQSIQINNTNIEGGFKIVLKKISAKIGTDDDGMMIFKNKEDKEEKTELGEVAIEGKRVIGKKVRSSTSKEKNGILNCTFRGYIPLRASDNIRVVVQPLWFDRVNIVDDENDSIFSYGRYIYKDFFEYDATQKRRMNFDMNNDRLYTNLDAEYKRLKASDIEPDSNVSYIQRINSDTVLINICDTLSGYDPDGSHPYPFGFIVSAMDYNVPVYSDTLCDNGERSSPLKFLDYSFTEFMPDKNTFKETLSAEVKEDSSFIKLNFLRGKAEINVQDTLNVKELDKVRTYFHDIDNDPGCNIVDVRIFGVASPEGSLERNEQLAKSRAKFAQDVICDALSPNKRQRVKIESSKVASWADVADSLARDGYIDEAAQIRDIIKEHPNDKKYYSGQYERIRRWNPEFYKKIDSVYLPKLRTVQYNYRMNNKRQLTNEEILDRYRNNDTKTLKRSEYWALFNHITDKKELERVAKEAVKNGKIKVGNESYEWPYALCLLACCYIARDTCDLNVLSPLLDLTVREDSTYAPHHQKREPSGNHRIIEYINYPEVAANQLIMCMRQTNRSARAQMPALEDLLDPANVASDPANVASDTANVASDAAKVDKKYEQLLSFSKCVRGGYEADENFTEEEAAEVRRVIERTSEKNFVVIRLAIKDYDAAAAGMDKLPEDAASNYLKAQIMLKKKKDIESAGYLAKSFIQDPRMITIANNDKDLIDEEKPNKKTVIYNAYKSWKIYMDSINQISDISVAGDSGTVLKSNSVPNEEKQPYWWFSKATQKALDNSNNAEDDLVKQYLYKCFELDRKYIQILNMALNADAKISKDEKAKQRLKSLRIEYQKSRKGNKK